MWTRTAPIAAAILVAGAWLSAASADDAKPAQVTVDNFRRAESDTYFARFEKEGGFGKFKHERELAPIDNQTVIRLNRDTLYSFGVFDLDAAPVTVMLPDAGKRYMALQVIDEDQYALDVFYAPGKHTLTRKSVGTRYVCLAVRTFLNPNDTADVSAVHALQDAIKVEQKAVGKFEVPNWDQAAHYTRLELHGTVVPPAEGTPRRRLEVPGGPAGKVTCQRATPNRALHLTGGA